MDQEIDNQDVEQSTAEPSLDQLRAQLAEKEAEVERLASEAAKYRGQRKKVETERDTWKQRAEGKATQEQHEENYKSLWQQEKEEKERFVSRAKKSDVENALVSRLTKVGVVPDMIDAAKKLVDQSMIEWDFESGVDGVTVDAAVGTLKKSYGFLFERKVSTTTPKSAADGKTDTNDKTLNKADFIKLSPQQQLEKMKQGYTVTE